MEQVEVRIITTAITHQYGTLETGTILRTSPDFARHLVEEARAAEYTTAVVAEPLLQSEAQPSASDEPEKQPKRKKTAGADAVAEEPPASPAEETQPEQPA